MTNAATATAHPDDPIAGPPLRPPPAKVKQFANLGIHTLMDLLFHLPRYHEDRSHFITPQQATHKERQSFRGVISAVTPHPRRRGAQLATLTDTDSGQALDITWFGQRHLIGAVPPGTIAQIHGPVFRPARRVSVTQPDIDFPDLSPPINTGRIVPVYPLTRSMTQQYLRRAILNTLRSASTNLHRTRPGTSPGSLHDLLIQAHFPDNMQRAQEALQALVSDEVLELQVALIIRRQQREAATTRPGLRINPKPRNAFLASLPYTPTDAQIRCIEEIAADLAADGPAMNRLLQGEVGSGKTTIALAAAIDTASADGHTTILTPTEILAQQHFATACSALRALPGADGKHIARSSLPGFQRPFTIGLLTASTQARQRRTLIGQARLGIIDLLIGTHSIIQPQADLPPPELAIADEQHRFGVAQRSALRRDSNYLMLTATPIPRTMQISLYRDLDVSTIDEMPPGRVPVRTIPIGERDRETVYQAIRDAVADGRQAIIVCPNIDHNDDTGAQSVSGVKDHLTTVAFPDLNIAIIHGRASQRDRERALTAFHQAEAQILLTTAVVEAGFDVPNATVMLIESSERFGMAQLHQLRGRVGRGQYPGTCYLMISPGHHPSPATRHRIRTVRDCHDGLALATADLAIRGHGQLDGLRQSGRSPLLRTGDAYDSETLDVQRQHASDIVNQDPDLSQTQNQALRDAARRFMVQLETADTDH